MITRDEIRTRSAGHDYRYPLVTIAEFFEGNTFEDSIAPNQYGEGRPDLAEIAARLTVLDADPAVAWIRVQLHEEMFDHDHDGIAAESVAICTSLPSSVIDGRLDVGELHAEPVWEGWSYDEDAYCDIPAIPDGHRVLTLVWD
ncbi:hypothetical protein [Nocardia stercoris]|nr:hypothetical protein [Nocardia stercoris]